MMIFPRFALPPHAMRICGKSILRCDADYFAAEINMNERDILFIKPGQHVE